MATKREVELIIKARDQAKAAIENVSGALEELTQNQKAGAASSANLDSSLGRLGAELQDLQRQAQGLSALNKVAASLDRSSKSVQRLEGNLETTQTEFRNLKRSAEEAATGFVQIRQRAQEAERSLNEQQSTLERSREEQRAVTEQLALARQRYRQLSAELRNSKDENEELTQSVARQSAEVERLISAQTRQRDVVRQQQAAVREAKESYTELSRELRQSETGLRRINKSLEQSAEASAQQSDALDLARESLSEIQSEARQAATALGGVEISQEQIAEASQRTATAITQVSAALQRQEQASRQASGAGAQGGAAQATAAFRAQIEAVRAAGEEYRRTREEATRLGQEIAQTENPTLELRTAFVLAQEAAREAGRAYNDQGAALTRLRSEVRQSAQAVRDKRAADREAQASARAAAEAQGEQARQANIAAVAARILGTNTETLNRALRGQRAAANQAAQGLRNYGDNSRRALNVTQRLRGQVLALTTTFFGFYEGIQQIGGVVDALRTVEAAASRLNAVFGGDQSRVRAELRFISAEADRLGLSFRVLSGEYGRFAVAANAANFSSQATREIFTSVAEAARVNKASTEELEGIYLALQQTISKGTVTSEELRRQLGDRLPGAFVIFADAIGVSTEQLDEMLRRGEVLANEDNLLKFARELQSRFGGALPAALRTTTTELDRFTNNIFEARRQVLAGGFEDALGDFVRNLNEQFQSREGRDFFLSIGAALSSLTQILTFVIDNIDLLFRGLQLAVSVRIGQFVAGLIGQFSSFITTVRASSVALAQQTAATQAAAVAQAQQISVTRALAVSLGATITNLVAYGRAVLVAGRGSVAARTAMIGLSASLATLRTALRSIIATLGPVGLAIAATGVLLELFGRSATQVSDATRAIDEHNRQLQEYQKEVQAAAREGREFNAALVETSAIEAQGNLEDLARAYQELREEASDTAASIIRSEFGRAIAGDSNETVAQIRRLTQALDDGKISTLEYQNRLREFYAASDDPRITSLIARLIATTEEANEAGEAMARQAAVAQNLGANIGNADNVFRAFNVTVDEGTREIRDFNDAAAETARLLDVQREAFEKLESLVPDIARAREREAELQAIRDQAQAVRDAAEATGTLADQQEEIDALEQRALAAARQRFAEEDQRLSRRQDRFDRYADSQRKFNESLEQANNLRRFELDLVGRTQREQAIMSAVFEAQQRAQNDGVQITLEQLQAIRDTTAALFDATEQERVQNLVLEQQARLRQALGQEELVAAQIAREARQQNIDLLTEEGQAWANVTRQIIERENAEERLQQRVEDLRALERQRVEAIRAYNDARDRGESQEDLEAREQALAEMRDRITESAVQARELAVALGDEKAVAQIDAVTRSLREQTNAVITATQINQMFAQGMTNFFDQAAQNIALAIQGAQSWGDAIRGIGDAFRQFAADFLRQIAQMITQALILRAIQSSGFGGFLAGGINGAVGSAGVGATVLHGGGIVGSAGSRRRVSAALFANALRYHNGGMPGLAPDEVPAILQRGERVIPKGGGGAAPQIKVVNAIDAGNFVSEGLTTKQGEQAIMNFIRDRRAAINGVLG